MLGKRPASPHDADHRDHSRRSVLPLAAAAVLFGFGLIGLLTVLPYSTGASDADPLFVTSPSQSPEPVATQDVRVQDIPAATPIVTAETIEPATPVPSTPVPAPTLAPAPPVFAVSVPDGGVAQLSPVPDPPTPTPTPPPPTATPTPTPSPTEERPRVTPSPSPTPDFIPDAREPGPIKPVEPVTAFFDPNFQQPAAVSPFGAGPEQFPVTPGR